MELLAVIYSVGGFAREDAANPAIAGIFTDPKIAEVVRKAAGHGAKIVPVEVDKIAPGYVSFASEVLNIDLLKIVQDKALGLKEFDDLDRDCLMTAQEYIEDADNGFLTCDDGNGYWATEKMISNVSCTKSQPEWATHVCWYNK